jgi:hypothetical protein
MTKKNLFDTIYDPKHNLLVNFSGVTSGGKVLSWLQIASTGSKKQEYERLTLKFV